MAKQYIVALSDEEQSPSKLSPPLVNEELSQSIMLAFSSKLTLISQMVGAVIARFTTQYFQSVHEWPM